MLTRTGNLPSDLRVDINFILQEEGEKVFGRLPQSDFFIDSKESKLLISRRHAYLRADKSYPDQAISHHIKDNSLNGTYVNRVRLFKNTFRLLNHGDIVTFGHSLGATIQPGCSAIAEPSEFEFRYDSHPSRKNSMTPPISNNVKVEVPDIKSTISEDIKDILSLTENVMQNFDSMAQTNLSQEVKTENPIKTEVEWNSSIKETTSNSTTASIKKIVKTDPSLENGKPKVKGKRGRPRTRSNSLTNESDNTEESNSASKKRRSATKKKSIKSIDDSLETHGAKGSFCDSSNCLKPKNKIINWVYCDFCAKWYHTGCIGVEAKSVSEVDEFHCGCSQKNKK